MKKFLFILLLIPCLVKAQFQVVGNQFALTPDGKQLRVTTGSPHGYIFLYQKYQVDSAIAKYTYLFTGTTSQYTDGTGHYQTFPTFQSPLSFNNGVTNTSGTVQLGGTLIKTTTIDISGNTLEIGDLTSGTGLIAIAPNEAILGSRLSNHTGQVVAYQGTVMLIYQSPSAINQTFIMNGNMTFTDPINNLGPVNGGAYEINFIPTSLITKRYADSVVKVARNAANFGKTATLTDVGHYTLPNTGDVTMRVGGWLNLLADSSKTVILQVTFTDEHSIVKTKSFYIQGSTSATLSSPEDYAFPTMDFRSLSGTIIQVSAIVSGAGTILYDVGCTIQKLIGDGG